PKSDVELCSELAREVERSKLVRVHVLDNPIWRALTTRQSDMALRSGVAARFHAEINLLAGFEGDAAAGFSALREIVAPGEQVGVFLAKACATPGFTPRAV